MVAKRQRRLYFASDSCDMPTAFLSRCV